MYDIDYTIRPVMAEDMVQLISLSAQHAEYEQAEYSSEGKEEQLAQHLFCDTPKIFCLVAVSGHQLIGYASYTFEFSTWEAALFLHLDCLFIVEHARRQGVGHAFFKLIASAANEHHCRIIQWQSPLWNETAIRFYHHLGAISKEKKRFYLFTDQLH